MQKIKILQQYWLQITFVLFVTIEIAIVTKFTFSKMRILQQCQYSQYIFKNKTVQMFSQMYCDINQRFLDNIDRF